MTKKDIAARILAEITGKQPSFFERDIDIAIAAGYTDWNTEVPNHEAEKLMDALRKEAPGMLARYVTSNPFFIGRRG